MVKLSVGVLKLVLHVQGKLRALFSYLGLLMSPGLDQYIFLENSEEKSHVELLCRKITLVTVTAL